MNVLKLRKTGISGFNEAVGGFYSGQIIFIIGGAGTGKTTFAAKFVHEGARKYNEPSLYISTVEGKKEFYSYIKNLGMDFQELEDKGLLKFVEILTSLSKDAVMNLSKVIKNVLLVINFTGYILKIRG